MKKKKRPNPEFNRDQMKTYMALSPEEKLKGLEEMNAFIASVLPLKAKKIQEELKKRGW